VNSGMRRRAASRLGALEGLLLLIGALCIGWYAGAHLAAWREQAQLERELEQAPPLATSSPSAAPAAAAPSRGGVVGKLEVPRLRLSVVAREGVDVRTLRRAAGHVPRTAMPGQPGNAAFAGHRDTFFRPLRDVRQGDEVVVTTPEGRYRYVVQETRVVKPTDVWVLEPTDRASLTLVTCYPFNYLGAAPQRFIVRATLAGTPAANAPVPPVP
jgi:sortase A